MKNRRLGFIGIVINNRKKSAAKVNQILSDYGNIIRGRIGLPCQEREVNVIALIIDGTNDEIGALTGKLGMLKGVSVKSALAKLEEDPSGDPGGETTY